MRQLGLESLLLCHLFHELALELFRRLVELCILLIGLNRGGARPRALFLQPLLVRDLFHKLALELLGSLKQELRLLKEIFLLLCQSLTLHRFLSKTALCLHVGRLEGLGLGIGLIQPRLEDSLFALGPGGGLLELEL